MSELDQVAQELLKSITKHGKPQLIDAKGFQEHLLHLEAKGLIKRIGNGWVSTAFGDGVAVTFRGNQAKVTRYEPLASGMCDTLIDIDGDAVWVSSHELKRADGAPIPKRRDVIRQAEREALESLHVIREQHVRDFNIPWPGAEHGKALVGQAINGAIRELEAKTSSGADVPRRSTVAQSEGAGGASAPLAPDAFPSDQDGVTGWGPERPHAPDCTYRMGHGTPCNCPKQYYTGGE